MRIAIYGAGLIGAYVGGRLAAAGGDVVLIGRARSRAALAGGLTLTDYRGARMTTGPLPFAEGPEGALGADLVLICVKSQASASVARELRPHLGPGRAGRQPAERRQ